MENFSHAIVSFLTSEIGLQLLGWVIGIAFTMLMGTEKVRKWLGEARIQKLQKAYQLLEAAIVSNRNIVAQMKAANGGKLTEDNKALLEKGVIDRLSRQAVETGFDAVKIIGPELIQPAIMHTVRRVSGKVVGKDATALPTSVAEMFTDTNI